MTNPQPLPPEVLVELDSSLPPIAQPDTVPYWFLENPKGEWLVSYSDLREPRRLVVTRDHTKAWRFSSELAADECRRRALWPEWNDEFWPTEHADVRHTPQQASMGGSELKTSDTARSTEAMRADFAITQVALDNSRKHLNSEYHARKTAEAELEAMRAENERLTVENGVLRDSEAWAIKKLNAAELSLKAAREALEDARKFIAATASDTMTKRAIQERLTAPLSTITPTGDEDV